MPGGILVATRGADAGPSFAYRLAACDVFLDCRLPALDAFRAGGAGRPPTPLDAPALRAGADVAWSVEDEGELGSWRWAFRVRADAAGGYEVELAGGAAWSMSADGRAVSFGAALDPHDPYAEMAVLGPALALALALRGTFVLHAGAALVADRAAAFLGASGAGKSTLAAALAARPGSPWRRIADDALPIAGRPGGPAEALPAYPQPRLEAAEQYVPGPAMPERVPLAGVYLLDASTRVPRVSIEAVPPREALATLLAHTMAARLFAPDLAAAHLAHCAAIVERVPVRRLAYPRRLDVFDDVAAALERDLEA